jgi:hypothetical protein
MEDNSPLILVERNNLSSYWSVHKFLFAPIVKVTLAAGGKVEFEHLRSWIPTINGPRLQPKLPFPCQIVAPFLASSLTLASNFGGQNCLNTYNEHFVQSRFFLNIFITFIGLVLHDI